MRVAPMLLAAIRCPEGGSADGLLVGAARVLQDEGLRLLGHVQHSALGADGCRSAVVEDLTSGEVLAITQDLGAGAQGCRMDPVALAAIAGRMLAALEGAPDLVVVNRFGKGEAEGQGLRAVIAAAVAAGIPVLTVLRPGHLAAWEAFTGGEADLLDPDEGAVLGWVRAAVAEAQRISA